MMDELGESSSLQVALLIDASASMKPKLLAVEEAIRDLCLACKQGKGRAKSLSFIFRARRHGEDCKMDLGWTDNLTERSAIFPKTANGWHDADGSCADAGD